MEFPGGETRDRQSGQGETEAEAKGSTWGMRMQGRRRLAHLGGRSPPQSADTKPGPPRGRDARPGAVRGARALCLWTLQPLGPRPGPAPG